MNIDAWLQAAVKDAERRDLPDLRALLENLALATKALRAADFNDDAASVDRDGAKLRSPDDHR